MYIVGKIVKRLESLIIVVLTTIINYLAVKSGKIESIRRGVNCHVEG